jgi:SAM-dependent methyltransferase
MEDSARVSRAFRDVDQSEAPGASVRYLAAVSGVEQTQRLKARTIDLLALTNGQVVLDVGCGAGDEVRAMASIVGSSGRAVGIDGSALMIEEAWKRSRDGQLSVDFQQADAHQLPFADNTFDGCRVERTLQHVADPRRVVAEMVRVAKPGSWVVAFEPDWETVFVNGGDRETIRALNRAHVDVNTRHGWIGRELPGIFHEAGLDHVAPNCEVFHLTDLPLARYLLNFDESAETAISAGWLTPAAYSAWLAALEVAAARRTFFAGLVGLIVVGTKPGSPAG